MSEIDEFSSHQSGSLGINFIWGSIPEPWDINNIKPVLHIYKQNKEPLIISHSTEPKEFIEYLVKAELLPSNRFIFITHGFKGDIKKEWLHEMKDAMITEDDQTVAIIDWGRGANLALDEYRQAASNSQAVGKWLAEYAIALNKYTIQIKCVTSDEIREQSIYIWGVGHSLGAHLMGKAGRTSKVFKRITGLDPAGPCFQSENQDKRLSKTDAQFVDVIHTDGMGSIYFGTLLPLGTVDFYPNFGYRPHGSDTNTTQQSTSLDSHPKSGFKSSGKLGSVGENMLIGHRRAYEYFIWSITNRHKFKTNLLLDGIPSVVPGMIGKIYPKVIPVNRTKWTPVTAEMGYYADKIKEISHGNYYLSTNAAKPWL